MQSQGKLILTRPGEQPQEFLLAKATATVGRGAINDIVLPDAKISREHARIESGDAGCTILDLGSANGTWVNSVRTSKAQLAPGDIITFGDSTLRYERAMAQVEPDVTILNTTSDLEMTLAQTRLSVTLGNTDTPRLVIHIPGKTWEVPLVGDMFTIGRDPKSDIPIEHPKVSRHHARVERRGNRFTVRDLKSTNGTWLGELRIEEHVLQPGDSLRIGSAQIVFKPGFEAEQLTLVDVPAPIAKAPRHPVVIVPGIMGSQLWLGSDMVWPNVRNLFSNPEIVRLPEPEDMRLEPRGIVGEVVVVPNLIKLEQYNRLGNYLVEGLGYERERDLMEFAYDWRQDVRLSAQRLAEAIDAWSVTPPITIIAHSLGGLVSRYYVELLGGKHKVGRLIIMGTPHIGTPKALTSLLLGPTVLPFGLLGDRLRQVMATFPSAYQILPNYLCAYDQTGQPIDLMNDDSWLAEEQRPLLRQAQEFRRELGTRSSVPTISIFGYGVKTLTRLTVQRDPQGKWGKMDLTVEPGGDVQVPEHSAILEGSEIHPVQQEHGVLFVDNDVKMRLKIELMRA
jgi:pSer/pThr/pTyr-binding forkhead associated (FHA) protein